MICLNKVYREKYPESLDPGMPADLSYTGPFRVTDPSEVPGVNIGKLILSPTRTYAPVMLKILAKHRANIHGLVHCSGGGQTKVLNFIDKLKVVKDNLFPVPPLFQLIQKHSGTSWQEMFKVFNMGHRFEIYLPEKFAADVIKISQQFNVEAKIIGHCEASKIKVIGHSSSGRGIGVLIPKSPNRQIAKSSNHFFFLPLHIFQMMKYAGKTGGNL